LLQKAVDILPEDTAESLQQRVMREAEQIILPQAIAWMSQDRVQIHGRRTVILKSNQEPSTE
jgi:phosphoribosylglycinamide formyltransferase-1